jgi:hypothetical protein
MRRKDIPEQQDRALPGGQSGAGAAVRLCLAGELILNLSDISCQLYVEAGRREAFLHLMATVGEVVNFESEVYRKDGKRIWISENAHVVSSNRAVSCITKDGARHFRAQTLPAATGNAGQFDALTGLPNRALLYDRLKQCVARRADAKPAGGGVYRSGQLQVHQ